MKKRAEKPKEKHAPTKDRVETGETPSRVSTPLRSAGADPHDPLATLLRGTYAHRACEHR